MAITLVTVAVLISVLRYTLPHLDQQKHRVEQFLADQYGIDLSIGQISAGWHGIGPSLVLQDVQLRQNAASPLDLSVQTTQIEIDFWASVLAGQIQSTRFELDGLALRINLAQLQQGESDYPVVDALQRLFLEQLQRFSVTDSHIAVTTRYDEQLIQIETLSWVNQDQHHQGVGQLQVVELASNSASFVLDLHGDPSDLNGLFYASAEALDVSPWLNQWLPTEQELTTSRANMTWWSGIKNSRVTDVHVEFGNSDFAWDTAQSTLSASVIGGDLRAEPDAEGWRFNLDNLIINIDQRTLASNWRGHIAQDGRSRLMLMNSIDVAPLLPLTALVLDEQQQSMLAELDPQASIDELAVMFSQQVAAYARFNDIGWQQTAAIPGLENLTAELFWQGKHGGFTLRGVQDIVHIDDMLDDDLLYQDLQAQGFVTLNDGGFNLQVPQLRLRNDWLSLTQRLAYDSHSDVLQSQTQIEPMSVARAKRLFPGTLMGQQTKAYLSRALVDGQVGAAEVLWFGRPAAFPFDNNQGVFQARVQISDSTFAFDPGWPALTDLSLSLAFDNEALVMTSEAGTLQGVELSDLHAVIPRLVSDARLLIDTHGRAEGQVVSQLMMDSDLSDSVGVALTDGVQLGGSVGVKLHLDIPLSGNDVVAKGEVSLDNNTLWVPSLDMTFNKVGGTVLFENDRVRVDELQADLLGQPVRVNYLGALEPGQGYRSQISMHGDWQVAALLEQQHPPLQDWLSGASTWRAMVDLLLTDEGYEYAMDIQSDLVGVGSSLPSPFAKVAVDSMPLHVVGQGDQQATTVKVSLGEDIVFNGVLPHDTLQFSRAHLGVGDTDVLSMGLGFSISAQLETVDAQRWYQAIDALIAGIPDGEAPMLGEPQRIYVEAQRLNLFGHHVDNLELVAKHSTQDWLLQLNAQQLRADVQLYYDWLNKGVDVQADFLDLTPPKDTNTDAAVIDTLQPDWQRMPPIRFQCQRCRLDDMDIGKVGFALQRADQGMTIESLSLESAHGKVQAQGRWQTGDDAVMFTALEGEFTSSDLGAYLKNLGVDSGIKDSKASFAFDLQWDGAPFAFNLESLDGDVNWRLSDGYLTDVSDKGSRIFSLLSLQSLVRKLSLDFRDVFAKGFFYDKMTGSFQVADGRAHTEDTVIDGGAGEMTLTGYTDLPSRALNYRIGFTPNVTSSLPLLVYWMVNPASAIAALAIDQVLTETKVISNVQYSLTGTLDEPQLTELDRKSRDISLPARVDTPPSSQGTPPVQEPQSPDSPGQGE